MATDYLQQLKDAGVPDSYLAQQTPGKSYNQAEYNIVAGNWAKQKANDAAAASTPTTQPYNAYPTTAYSFDPNKYLPDIQKQAASIYNPQLQALESLRKLGNQQAETSKIQSESDYKKALQREVESINSRGAFFSGGAIEAQGQMGLEHQRSLDAITMQAQAAEFTNLAQQAGLSAEQANYIKDQLYNTESSAYNRWSSERDFQANEYWKGKEYTLELDKFAESQKQFAISAAYDLKRLEQEFSLSKAELKAAESELAIAAATAKSDDDYKKKKDAIEQALAQSKYELDVDKFKADLENKRSS